MQKTRTSLGLKGLLRAQFSGPLNRVWLVCLQQEQCHVELVLASQHTMDQKHLQPE